MVSFDPMRKTVFFFVITLCFASMAQMPKQLNSAEILQKMKKLNVLGNVLYLAAHPDDENTRFISYCANEELYNTAYLSLTRGDGGQNLVGTEIREELGIIRTQELLAARRTDGGEQFFTRANDFGYSKTAQETLEIWDKDKILADVVWTIRKFRSDVIVCRFPTDGGGGHGHHTSSALLAKEAFSLAGDKTKYPEQLEFVEVWQPTRVVVNTGRWWNDKISDDDPGVVTVNIGKYNEMLGMSYNELAARSRTMHKSQGFGSTGSRGDKTEFFEHLAGEQAEHSLFEGFVSSWSRISGGQEIKTFVEFITTNYVPENPSASISYLVEMREVIERIPNKFWREIKLKEVDELIVQCAGLYMEAKADEFSKCNGDSVKVSFEIVNRSNVGFRLQNINGNELAYSFKNEQFLHQNKLLEETATLMVSELPISQPYWLAKEGSLGTYNVGNQQLIGSPENKPAVNFTVELMVYGQVIAVDIPLIYKWNDPVDGEMYRPFIITPEVTANVNQSIALFSSKTPKEIEVVLKAHKKDQTGSIEINLPNGWSSEFNKTYSLSKKGEEQTIMVKVIPTDSAVNGDLTVSVNGEQLQSFNEIKYSHIPTQVWFPSTKTRLVYVDVVTQAKNIGYIVGAGDVVPDALKNLGYEVDLLEEKDLEPANLKKYDAILTGIRFLNVNERAPFMMPKLLKYAEDGGNLIVQYNTRHRMKTQDFGPYPIKLSRDRVTEEDAKVTFISAEHPVLNTPNKITALDFEEWVQERGLYFPSEWDEKYAPILSWHDINETPKTGSLLVTKFGEGNYVYTGISFFRELPAGVPGAHRLLVNLIEMGNE